jgi:hypothetical protein
VRAKGPGQPPPGGCPASSCNGTEAAGQAEGAALCFVRGGLLFFAVGLATLVFYTAARALGPGTLGLPPFNSDAAVPVLMANETHWDLFHAYYFGQDRFGAWPFLLAHWVGTGLHRPVTPELLHLVAMGWLAAGALPAMLLCPGRAALGVLAYLIALLVPETRALLFDSQPYGWQVPLLLWAWWAIRRSWSAEATPARAGWLCLSTLLCTLATWTSDLSGPLLVALSLLEGFGWEARSGDRPWRRWLLQLLPATVGIGAEVALRAAYHHFVRNAFHRDFRSMMHLDTGHLLSNAGRVGLRLWTPFVFTTLLVLTSAMVVGLVRRWRTPGTGWRLSPLACTLAGAFLLAMLPLPVLGAVAHVRLNDYQSRYFAPTYVFAVWGGLLAATAGLASRLRGWGAAAALAAGTLALGSIGWQLRPDDGSNPDYRRLQATARLLAQRTPGTLLLDGYWGTYVFAALAPPGQLVGLPSPQQWNRTPAAEERLARAPSVLVGHRELLGEKEGAEPRWLFAYGTLLERQEVTFFSDGIDRFSSYRPRAVEEVPHVAEPSLEGLNLLWADLEVTLRAERPWAETALAVDFFCRGAEPRALGWAEDALGQRLPLQVTSLPGSVFFFFPPTGVPTRALHVSFGRAGCQLRAARWFVQPKEQPD